MRALDPLQAGVLVPGGAMVAWLGIEIGSFGVGHELRSFALVLAGAG